MHVPINVKSPNIRKWQMGFNSAFKGLRTGLFLRYLYVVKMYILLLSSRHTSWAVCVYELRYKR
jgi:hypothetical protein